MLREMAMWQSRLYMPGGGDGSEWRRAAFGSAAVAGAAVEYVLVNVNAWNIIYTGDYYSNGTEQ
jgi:hypothetical protein